VLIALTLAVLVVWATLPAAVVARVVDELERRRLRRVAAQIRVTDAVHGALGPIVAPTVTRHRGQPWTVTIRLGPRDFEAAGRLVELAEQALGSECGPVRVVLATRSA
jgi:hypothetical protein